MVLNRFSVASMRWSECGGGLYNIERKQWNDRENEKSMMIVSYARYIRVPAGNMAGLLQQQQQ